MKRTKKMERSPRRSAHDQRRHVQLQAMIRICVERGITSQHLRQTVHDTATAYIHVDDPIYIDRWEFADEVSSAGLAAQLSYLMEALGASRVEDKLMTTGGILDAIVHHVSSSPEEVQADIGLQNIDEDGDVIDD